MNRIVYWLLMGGLPLALLLAGCAPSYYRKSADRAAYGAIKEKTSRVPNMDPRFTIEQTNIVALEGLPITTNVYAFLGPDGQREDGAHIINLEKALEIAVKHSRAYQLNKENLYLDGLALAATRHRFTPIFSGDASGRFSGSTEQTVSFVTDPVTGELTPVISSSLEEQNRVSASGSLGFRWLMRDIGQLSAEFSTTFLRVLGGNQNPSSRLNATFVRPLLRDAGYKTQMEALTQGERNLLYSIRQFTDYRREFSIGIATAYYRVLSSRDSARNNFANLESSRKNAERTRALADEGRVTQSDLGRLAQQELSAETAWINAVRNYQQSLDNFKLQLGLATDVSLVLDDSELDELEIDHPNIPLNESIQTALLARLDFASSRDRLEDAERQVKLQANLLKPQVNFTSTVGLNSDPDKTAGIPLPELDRYSYSAGLDVDPGFDKTAERDSYRSALISRERALRAVAQQQDEIKVAVRDSWRELDSAKRNFEISEIGVNLAERRVEEQTLLAELGRAKAQDQVDAQNDLLSSKNQRTQALVAHTIARLQFWNNIGILYIKDDGQWQEIQNAKAN